MVLIYRKSRLYPQVVYKKELGRITCYSGFCYNSRTAAAERNKTELLYSFLAKAKQKHRTKMGTERA